MVKNNKKFWLIFAVIFSLNKPLFASDLNNLTIFSEGNMAYFLTEIARNYSSKENVAISTNFNSSSYLIDSIDLGEPGDIFIASHPDWIIDLSQKGLVDHRNSLNFATDKLVLIASKKNQKVDLAKITKSKDFNQILELIREQKLPLIIGSESSSVGKYTKSVMANSNLNKFQIFKKLGEDRKSIIDFINSNKDYFGIVMKSEAFDNPNIVIVAEVPDIIIDYKALVIAGDNMENARKFVEYLKSKYVKDALIKNGFMPF